MGGKNTMYMFIGIDIGVANVYTFDDGTIVGHGNNGIRPKMAVQHIQAIVGNKTPLVIIERLNICSMEKYRWHMKSALDSLIKELKSARIRYSSVPPFDTSRMCSKCGSINTSSRDGRNFLCVDCGFECDADVNAAKNIKKRGKKPKGRSATKRISGKRRAKKKKRKKRSSVEKHLIAAKRFERNRSMGVMSS